MLVLLGCQTEPGPADTSGSPDPLTRIVDSARWAQNAHNVQSWRLERLDAVTLQGGLDSARLLPQTDPDDRQLILSLGALSQAARMAAASEGLNLSVRWMAPPDWVPRTNPGLPVVEWKLMGSTPVEPIDALSRPTVKYKVTPARLTGGVSSVDRFNRPGVRFFLVDDGKELSQVLGLARDAYSIEMTSTPTLMESVNYTVYGAEARTRHPYGITLLGNFDRSSVEFMEFLAQTFRQTPEQYGHSGIEMLGKVLDHCQQLVVLTTSENTPRAQFEAGEALQEMWMSVLDRGEVLLPLSQGLQEAQQFENDRRGIHALLAHPGETVQMIWAVERPDGEFLRAPRIPAKLLFVSEQGKK